MFMSNNCKCIFRNINNIIRDDNDHIISIKEIKEIYKSTDLTKDYIYKYSDDSTTDTITSDYSLIFSTDRIKVQNSIISNAVYYFEIPVDAGEFAIGAAAGKSAGAYLMYLDLGTNGGTSPVVTSVDDFASVEYRSTPDFTEHSILLITYEQSANQLNDLTLLHIPKEAASLLMIEINSR